MICYGNTTRSFDMTNFEHMVQMFEKFGFLYALHIKNSRKVLELIEGKGYFGFHTEFRFTDTGELTDDSGLG